MLQGALSTQRVFDLSLATERRKIQPDGNKIVQKYGEIYGRQALRQIEDDREEEARVVNMREARLTRPWRMKYKAIVSDLDKCILVMESSLIATHYALLIGLCFIPKEQRQKWPLLRGCTRDVQEIKQLLANSSSRVHIQTLTASLVDPDVYRPLEDKNDLSTHENIISNLKDITSRALVGNFVYIHFSGHGMVIQLTSPYANDYTGELVLVVIVNGDVTKIEYLEGFVLADQLKKIVEKGLKVTLVLDYCASGSVVQGDIDLLMLYGNTSLHFFEDTNYTNDSAAIPVINKNVSLILEAGQAHGVCEGDKFALSAPGLTKPNILVEITYARDLTSSLKLLDPTPISLASGMTAAVRTRLSLQRFPVRLELHLPCRDTWDVALQKQSSLDIRYSNNARSEVLFKFHIILLSKNCYEIWDESNQRIPDLPIFYDLDKNPDYVLDIVHHLAEFKLVRHLVNNSLIKSTSPFKGLFSVHIKAAEKTFHPGCRRFGMFHAGCSHEECMIMVKDGEQLELIVQNNTKEKNQKLHIHLYCLGSSWEIENGLKADYEVISPRYSNQDDEDYENGTNGVWSKVLTMTLAQELKDKGKCQCDDILKIFLTARPTSFISLELPEVGKLTNQRKNIENGREGSDGLAEDWAALNFHVRTYKKLQL
ncbi:hypothetical protein B7463_g7312, partial [Scytalidium lignicola]